VPTHQPEAGGHYFSARPATGSAPAQVELPLPEGRLLRLAVDRGVFSGDRVDPGTRILLAEGPPVAHGVLVDVGCGYGPIAVALALRAGPGSVVWAVDVNERARALCAANAEANGVADRVRVVAPDDVPTDLVVDQIWSNPPIRIGKAALHDLLTTWLGRLRPGTGTAALVVQKHLGSDSLARWLKQRGWPTERLASRGGYRVLHVTAPPTSSSAAAGIDGELAGDLPEDPS
jgi:16S rRNA (guanine1207-N2)-methyltransferase